MSAIAVTAYKYFLYSTNDANGAAIGILPVAILFVVPAVVAVAYVVIRSVLGMVLARLFRCESICTTDLFPLSTFLSFECPSYVTVMPTRGHHRHFDKKFRIPSSERASLRATSKR